MTSYLPEELLTTIATYLISNPIDIIAFNSVSKLWNNSSRHLITPIFPSLLPLQTPISPSSQHDPHVTHTLLSLTFVFSLQPRHSHHAPWICFIDQWNKKTVSIRVPFSKLSYTLPDDFPKTFDLFDFHVSELGSFYNLTNVFDYVKFCASYSAKSIWWSGGVVKVILVSHMSAAVMLSYDESLWLLRLDTSAEQWDIIRDAIDFHFVDIIEFKGNLLGVDCIGSLYEIRLHSTVKIDLIAPLESPIDGRDRLVESIEELYLVSTSWVPEMDDAALKVYQLVSSGVGTNKWEQVSDIGEMIFFFGVEFSLSISTQQLGGVYRKNCVVYAEESFRRHTSSYNTIHRGLEPYVLRVSSLEDVSHVGAIRSYPSYTKLLWPPPSWFCPNVKSDEIYLDHGWPVNKGIDPALIPRHPYLIPATSSSSEPNHSLKWGTLPAHMWSRENFHFHNLLKSEDFVRNIENQQLRGLEPSLLEIIAAPIDGLLMTIPNGRKECFEIKSGELGKEELDNSQGAIIHDGDGEQRKEKIDGLKGPSDEGGRVLEASRISGKRSLEVGEPNVKVVEESHPCAHKVQKQLKKFHQLFSNRCSRPSTCSQYPDFHDS